MKEIKKIIINTEFKLIHIFFENEYNNISYQCSERFKLVIDTIKGTKNEKQKIKKF